MRHRGFQAQFATFVIAMMADNIEHVISYWMLFQKFHSPALAGFAIVSHWLPFLLFSVASGALADRVDPRRLIQCGMGLFIAASLAWGYFFFTGTLQMWQAMVILVIHGCAGVLWMTPNQICSTISSAPKISKARCGSMRPRGISPSWPVPRRRLHPACSRAGLRHSSQHAVLSAARVVAGERALRPALSQGRAAAAAAVRGFADIVQTARDIKGHSVVVAMTLLAGAAAFFVGNSYSPQMPGFAHDLGHGDPGFSYSMLLAADARAASSPAWCSKAAACCRRIREPRSCWRCCGAARSADSRSPPITLWRSACCSPRAFSNCRSTPWRRRCAIERAADNARRVIGLFNMSSLGLRAFSAFRSPPRRPDRRALVAGAVGAGGARDRRGSCDAAVGPAEVYAA